MEETNHFEKVKKGPMLAIMLVGAFMGLLNETLLATALPSIMDYFDIQRNEVQWLTTAFLLTNGVMIPISAFLIERFSTRQLFITALSIFATGTLVATLSNTFWLLLIARVIQAGGSGIMLPLLMTVMLTVIPIERRGAAMGTVGIVISFAPAIGPTLSGWLLEFVEWRGLFYVVLPIAAIAIIGASIFTKNVTKLTYPKIDILSIILSSLGFGGLLYGFSSFGGGHSAEATSDFSWLSVGIIAASAIILTLFILRQMKMEHPMLEFRVFKNPIFTLAIIITMIVLMALIGAETMLPLYMQDTRGFSALESGLMLLPGAVVMGIMSPITGALFDKFGAKWLAFSGLAIVSVTTFFFTNLSMDTPYAFLVVIYAIRMFGLSLTMMPVMTAGLNQLPESWHPHGSAMANTMQQVSASIGTAILVAVMTSRASSQMEGVNPAQITTEVVNQANLSGYNTAFWLATLLSVAGLVLSLFLTTKASEKAKQEAA